MRSIKKESSYETHTKRLGNSMLLPKSGRVALHMCINAFSPTSTS